MKRIWLLILLSVLVLSACQADYMPVWERENTQQDEEREKVESIPKYIEDIFKAYKLFENEHVCTFQTSGVIRIPGVDYGSATSENYEFTVQEKPATFYDGDIKFEDNGFNKLGSFSVFLPEEMDKKAVKQFLTATIMAVDSTCHYEEAIEETRKIVVSYSGEGCSDLYISDDYTIFISNCDICEMMKGIQLYAVANEGANVAIEKSEYRELTHNEIVAPLNSGEMVLVEGIVTEIKLSRSGHVSANIKNEEGNDYYIYYNFIELPIILETDVFYSVYGTTDKGLIETHYLEKN